MTCVHPLPWTLQSQWLSGLLFPAIPAYRAFFELVAACVKGQCLETSDVFSTVGNGALSPRTMVFGADDRIDLTPPESLASFVGLVLVQLAIIWPLILFFDWYHNPPLHDSGIVQAGGNREQTEKNTEGAILEVQSLVHH